MRTTTTSEENRYGLGIDTDSGKHFLAIPVTNGVADYNEYYEVPASSSSSPVGTAGFPSRGGNHAAG